MHKWPPLCAKQKRLKPFPSGPITANKYLDDTGNGSLQAPSRQLDHMP
jgi:hypothetical protein